MADVRVVSTCSVCNKNFDINEFVIGAQLVIPLKCRKCRQKEKPEAYLISETSLMSPEKTIIGPSKDVKVFEGTLRFVGKNAFTAIKNEDYKIVGYMTLIFPYSKKFKEGERIKIIVKKVVE